MQRDAAPVFPRAETRAGCEGGAGCRKAAAAEANILAVIVAPEGRGRVADLVSSLAGHDDQRARMALVAAEERVLQPGLDVDVDRPGAVGRGQAVRRVVRAGRPGRAQGAAVTGPVALTPGRRVGPLAFGHHHRIEGTTAV